MSLFTFVAASECNVFSAPALFEAKNRQSSHDGVDQDFESGLTAAAPDRDFRNESENAYSPKRDGPSVPPIQGVESAAVGDVRPDVEPRRHSNPEDKTDEDAFVKHPPPRTITFDTAIKMEPKDDGALYIPGPRDRDRGHPLVELNSKLSDSHEGR